MLQEVEQVKHTARLLVADDHVLVRTGLITLLSSEADFAVVGEAENGREALELCRLLRPDVALLDSLMPELDGLSATRAIKRELPSTSVIIMAMYEDAEYLLEALRAGAAGYLLKSMTQVQLVESMHTLLRGESFLNSSLATRALQRLAREPHPAPAPLEHPLTTFEDEVLRLVVCGCTNREIAASLAIGVDQAKAYVERIIGKLGASDRLQAAVRASELGLTAADREAGR